MREMDNANTQLLIHRTSKPTTISLRERENGFLIILHKITDYPNTLEPILKIKSYCIFLQYMTQLLSLDNNHYFVRFNKAKCQSLQKRMHFKYNTVCFIVLN